MRVCFFLLACFLAQSSFAFTEVIEKRSSVVSGSVNIEKNRWNMISSPLRGDIDISYFTKYTSKSIWGYDGSAYYSATKIERGKGYWLYADKDGGLALVSGYKNENTLDTPALLKSRLILNKWNLVGTDLDATVNDIKLHLGVSKVYSYNPQTNSYIADGNIHAGSGMWIYGENLYGTSNWYDHNTVSNTQDIL